MRRFAVLLPLSCLFSTLTFAQIPAEQRSANLASFDHVWETVRAKHWDPTLGGLDWDAVRAELRPKVEAAHSDAEVRAIIADMLSRLHLTHYGVFPGSVYRDVENDRATSAADSDPPVDSEPGTVGIDVRVVDGEPLVTGVDPDSSAGKQGVRPGWLLRRIHGEDLLPVLKRVNNTYQHSTMQAMMLARTVLARLDGPVENSVEVDFRDGRDRLVTLTLQRNTPRGAPEKFGYMPESRLWISERQITPLIGYIAFNYFLDPVRLTAAFQDEIQKCTACRGLVIDLRGNPGGIGILAMGLAGYFIDKPNLKLGTLYMRDLPMNFVVNPRPPAFSGSLAILIDGLSASTSEIFAGGLQDLKRARIFGSRSAGAALPSQFERLPNGDGFQYAMATYKSESGQTLEGTGVQPDVPVALSRAELLAGRDPILDSAVHWLSQKGLISQ